MKCLKIVFLLIFSLQIFLINTASSDFFYRIPPIPPILTSASANSAAEITVVGLGAMAGALITVYADGNPVGTGTADGSGNFNFTVSTSLTPGAYNITVTQTVASEESAPSNIIAVIIILQIPTLISATASTNQLTVTGSGADPNAIINVYVNGLPVGNGLADGFGNFNFSINISLTPGIYAIFVRETVGSNQSGSSNEITITVSAPASSSKRVVSTGDNSGANKNGALLFGLFLLEALIVLI